MRSPASRSRHAAAATAPASSPAHTPAPAPTQWGEVGMLFGQCGRMVWTEAARAFESSEHSMFAWGVLKTLVALGPLNQSEIATVVRQHPAGISRLLDEIERSKLVARTRDAVDRRKVRVEITAAGRAWLATATTVMDGAVAHAMRALDASDLDALKSLLRKIVSLDTSSLDPQAPVCAVSIATDSTALETEPRVRRAKGATRRVEGSGAPSPHAAVDAKAPDARTRPAVRRSESVSRRGR